MERCNPKQDCPQWPTCHEDDHHTFYPERVVRHLGGTMFFLAHVERGVCRAAHEQLHIDEPTNLPSREQIEAWHKEKDE